MNISRSALTALHSGDVITLSGTVYTARDAAHKRLIALLDENKPLPFPLTDAVLYYAGPTPAKNGMAIGSCGPTTASRMDSFTPRLMQNGLLACIGKGERSQTVVDACKQYNAVYLCAIGGAGALAATCITHAETVAFEELGCEAIRRLTFADFPLIVAVDSMGNNLFHR